MRTLLLVVAAVAICLGGCAKRMVMMRADGQPLAGNPVLAHQAEMDATACLGERNKAALSGVSFHGGGMAGLAASIERGQAADTVQRGCMADRGYLFVTEDEAAAKQAQLAAIAETKRQQEAAAIASPPSRTTTGSRR